jgi:hypothetical protein
MVVIGKPTTSRDASLPRNTLAPHHLPRMLKAILGYSLTKMIFFEFGMSIGAMRSGSL